MKKITASLVIVILLIVSTCCSAFSATMEITVKVNGNKIDFPDAKPFIDTNNRTLIPVRFVSEALGAKVDWDAINKEVNISQNENKIKLIINESKIYVNNQIKTMDTKAIISQDRTFVPIRFVGEALGATVEWESSTKTVLITTAGPNNNNNNNSNNNNNNTGISIEEENKAIADMIRTVIDLEMKKEWDKVYDYLSKESLERNGITSKEGFGNKYVKLSGGYKAFINMYDLKEYYTRCVVDRISDSKAKVRHAMFRSNRDDSSGLYYDARYLTKIDGKWYIEIEPLIVENTELFYFKDGI